MSDRTFDDEQQQHEVENLQKTVKGLMVVLQELVTAAGAMLEHSRAEVPTNADTPSELLQMRHRLAIALALATE